jgi:xylulokinase
VLVASARLLGVNHDQYARLALSAPPGSGGLVVLPYVEKGSTLARLPSTGAVYGMTPANSTAAHFARGTVEGVLCGLAEALDALMLHNGRPQRLLLIGGATRSEAVRRIAPTVFCQPVIIPGIEELGAYGAARQAAWALTSTPDPPPWRPADAQVLHTEPVPTIRSRFADARRLQRSIRDWA